ncbi:helix-turn-helix domain-containing protein, partial [Pseudomonas sp. JG-B]
RKVNLRIISATNCNLEQMVQQGKFRRDLFFRLRIISVRVPRLYARGDDILLLARHFLKQHGERYGKSGLHFSVEAEHLLQSYSWPGNVRELRNMLEQTVLLSQGQLIGAAQLHICPSLVEDSTAHYRTDGNGHGAEPEAEREMVIRMLDKTDWNVTKSARLLGLTRDMLRYRIEKLGLIRPDRRH